MISDFDIVKSQIKLSEVVIGKYKKMPSGMRYKICPICGGEDSFGIMLPGKSYNSCEIFKCFKCDNHGSIIDYYCLINGLNPKDKKDLRKALLELKNQYNVGTKTFKQNKNEYLKNKQKNLSTDKKIEYDFTNLAYELHENLINKEKFFVPVFSGDEYQDMATSYYVDRGLSVEIIKKFKLGYHSLGMNGAFRKFPNLSISKKKDFYEYFIPFFENEKCTYILPRFSMEKYEMYKEYGLLEINESLPKVMNLRGIPSQIFNFKDALKNNIVYITEGWCDALSIETLGYNALAINGVSNINLFIKKLKDIKNYYNKDYVIALDSDNVGNTARQNLSNELINMKCRVKHLYPSGNNVKDINDMMLRNRKKLEYELKNINNEINLQFKR